MRQFIFRYLLVWLLVWGTFAALVAYSPQSDELVLTMTVEQLTQHDFRGTEFYQLRRGNLAAVISIDPANDLARYLKRHNKQRIALQLSAPDAVNLRFGGKE